MVYFWQVLSQAHKNRLFYGNLLRRHIDRNYKRDHKRFKELFLSSITSERDRIKWKQGWNKQDELVATPVACDNMLRRSPSLQVSFSCSAFLLQGEIAKADIVQTGNILSKILIKTWITAIRSGEPGWNADRQSPHGVREYEILS